MEVVSGSVDVGQPLLLRPANDRAVVKALYSLASTTSSSGSGSGSSGAPKAYAEAGDGVSRQRGLMCTVIVSFEFAFSMIDCSLLLACFDVVLSL